MSSGKPRISITIPAYNEEVMLEEVVREARRAAFEQFDDDYEVLIVDDGSVDRTGEIASRLAREHAHVRVVHHPHNRGFSGAMVSCVEHAEGDYVFLGPADGQADYRDIRRFWELVDRFDLIFGQRPHHEGDVRRKLGSTIWYGFIRALFGAPIPEFSSLFCFRRNAIPELAVPIRPDASNFLPVLYLTAVRNGVRVGTLDIEHGPRRGGEAKGDNMANAIRTMAEDIALAWRLRTSPRR